MGCETHWDCHIPVLPRTSDTWSAQYIARSNRSHPSTFPNVAPWQEKQSQQSSNINKFFLPLQREITATASGTTNEPQGTTKTHQTSNARTVAHHSDHVATVTSSSRAHKFAEATFPALEMHFAWKMQHVAFRLTTKLFHMLRLPRKLTLQLHTLRLPRKAMLQHHQMCACHEKWHSATKSDIPTSNAAAKSDTPTSPNDAPATKSDIPTSPHVAPRGVMWMMRDVGDVWCEWCVMWVMWVMCECFEWCKMWVMWVMWVMCDVRCGDDKTP